MFLEMQTCILLRALASRMLFGTWNVLNAAAIFAKFSVSEELSICPTMDLGDNYMVVRMVGDYRVIIYPSRTI